MYETWFLDVGQVSGTGRLFWVIYTKKPHSFTGLQRQDALVGSDLLQALNNPHIPHSGFYRRLAPAAIDIPAEMVRVPTPEILQPNMENEDEPFLGCFEEMPAIQE